VWNFKSLFTHTKKFLPFFPYLVKRKGTSIKVEYLLAKIHEAGASGFSDFFSLILEYVHILMRYMAAGAPG
jgi:hypothetical protein